ncbi:extracellular solute-binding protein [Enterococcus gallinarum]|uniref:extracellular solute-binding protein n=1 Tax=Enterococcus gallinarum TaxID=1353 RepID=UPI003D1120FA|nr:extracellular solute-binding protein [Enterococcus faecalis]
MRFNWKKFSAVCIVSLGVIGLSACGGDSEKKASSSSEKSLEVSVPTEYVKYINDVKSEFEKDKGISVKVIEKDTFEQLDALPLDGSAGIGPDVTLAPFDRVGQGASQGYLSEVKLPKDDRFNEKDQRQVSLDGKTYGQPAMVEALLLYYNKDLIAEAPKSFSDLEKIAKDDKYKEGDKNIGFLARWTDLYFTYGLIAGNGGYIFGDKGTDASDIGLNNEGAVKGITYAANWFKNIWPEGMLDSTANSNLISDYFNQGKTAAIISGPWDAKNMKDSGVNYGVSKIPTLDNGNEYASFGGGKAWVISNFSKNKDVANDFLEYLTNEKNQDKLYEMRADVPANLKSQKKVQKSDDELSKAVIDQYTVSEPMPNIPEMAEVWSGAENMLFDAGSNKMTPQEAADNAVKTIKESIEQKY